MISFLAFLAILIGIMILSALLFGGWVIATVLRGIGCVLGLCDPAPTGFRRRSGAVQIGPLPSANVRICANELCRTANEPGARYCRRCGQALAPPQQVRTRRAAMW